MTSIATILISGLLFAIAIFYLLSLEKRLHGKKVEKTALSQVERNLPNGWKMQSNVTLYYGGDLDLLLIVGEHRFAIEIKSFVNAKLKRKYWFFGKERLINDRGTPVHGDPLNQIGSAANQTKSTPILWLPNASKRRPKLSITGIALVTGNYKALFKYIKSRLL